MTLRKSLAISGLIPGALLLQADPAQAQGCEVYLTCCQQLVGAYEEAGVPAARVEQFDYTCHLQDRLAAFPDMQRAFCYDAWEAISREAFQHFQQRRIGFYPESCWEDPTGDPLELIFPDLEAPELVPIE